MDVAYIEKNPAVIQNRAGLEKVVEAILDAVKACRAVSLVQESNILKLNTTIPRYMYCIKCSNKCESELLLALGEAIDRAHQRHSRLMIYYVAIELFEHTEGADYSDTDLSTKNVLWQGTPAKLAKIIVLVCGKEHLSVADAIRSV